ncbi:hypothetical protein NC651_028575 [Populus alba x Populus x berolinensis]|nr:hypothetical protein NC651_028575 [Populus alba x Populus x berolinensis]
MDFLSRFLPLLLFLWFYSLAYGSKGQGTRMMDAGCCWFFFSCFCSFVPLLSSPYAAQFSFLSPFVSFYSPCSLSLPLCLVFLLSVLPPFCPSLL